MNGMEMMLKSMGLDPVQLKEQAEGVGKLVETIANKLNEIDARLVALDAKVSALLAVTGTPATAPEVPAPKEIDHA
jgi:hypothetical protein